MRISFYYTAVIFIATLISSCGAENDIKKADQSYALGDYFDAAKLYRKAYSAYPAKERQKRGICAFRMGEAYRHINYNIRALSAYQNAIRYKYPDSTAYFYLAEMQRTKGDYKNAILNYEAYLKFRPNDILARNGLYSSRMAPTWRQQASRYNIKRENAFNGRRSDFSPVLFGDAFDQLFVTTTRPQAKGDEFSGITGIKNSDIFVASKDEKGAWKQLEALDSEVNSDYDEGTPSFSPDGKTMYFTRCTTDESQPRYATIWSSQRSDASWATPKQVQITNDTLSSFAHPAVSPDGRWLYFVSDMYGGEGGLDIWRMALGDESLGIVENLGPTINTPGNEMFPTFRPNGDLYFSSNGHPGMGGLDIFIARKDSAGGFLPPVNPGFPLNSLTDDFGMTFEGPHNRGFFASNRGDARGWDHIYSFELPEILQTVKGWVYEKDGYELPAAQVYLVGNDGTNIKLNVKMDGSFTQIIKPNVDYVMLGTCKGFLNYRQQLRVDTVSRSEEYVLQFPLASITAPVLIDNIFYEFDKADLTPESTTSLDQLIELLNQNPNVTIELSAHCDYRGNEVYNKILSQRRAESVVNYLIKGGIARDRLTPIGYGKERPKKVRRKLTEKYEFLTEGDELSEDFIRKLTPEQQDTCNQLNRRTEFRVLRTTYGL